MSFARIARQRGATIASSLLTAILAPIADLTAQAPGLRDPARSVFAAYPAANGYQAIARNIDTATRQRIEESLPFRVHWNEIGEHSVYVALRGRLPLGMIYVLREEDAFGLTEVEWAITFDMRLSAFRFQRTRSRHREALEGSEFARLLIGRSASDLATLIDSEGRLSKAAKGVPPGAEELAAGLVRAALKALTVVDKVWTSEVEKLHDLALGMTTFPTAQRFVRVWPPLTAPDKVPVAPPPTEAAQSTVVVAVRAFTNESRSLGVVAKVTASATSPAIVTWTVDESGKVLASSAEATAPAALRAACHEAAGKSLAEVGTQSGEAAESAAALTALLWPPARPGRER